MEVLKNKALNQEELKLKNLFLVELAEISELFPNYTLAQHLHQILMKKPKNQEKEKEDFFFWTTETLVKNTEKYRYTLEEELAEDVTE